MGEMLWMAFFGLVIYAVFSDTAGRDRTPAEDEPSPYPRPLRAGKSANGSLECPYCRGSRKLEERRCSGCGAPLGGRV